MNLKIALTLLEQSPNKTAYDTLIQKYSMEFPTKDALDKYLKQHPKADPQRHKVVDTKREPKQEKDLFDKVKVKMKGQNHKTPEALFEEAKETFEMQLDYLNRGKGLDSLLKAKVYRGDKKEAPDLESKGAFIQIGPLKRKERSEQKVNADYGGDWSRLTDIVRASIAVDTYDEVPTVISLLKKKGLTLAKPPKDRFKNPTPAGYRDILLNIVYPNGHVGELQVHVKPMLTAKEGGHKFYEEVRDIESRLKEEGRESFTEEEMSKIDKANNNMKNLYNTAWQEAQGSGLGKKGAKSKTTSYFDLDGVACLLRGGDVPKKIVKGKEKPIYDLEKFFQEATEIDKKEFDALKSK